jgi:phosphoribosylanthranilate isomerase
MVRIKFCGLTSLSDATAAIELGADLLGFNFYARSPRYLSPADCRSIVQGLAGAVQQAGRPVLMVGVFVNHPPEQISTLLKACGLDLAQLSGDEPAEDLHRIGPAAYKAIRPGNDRLPEEAIQAALHRHSAPAFLIDASIPGEYGGTGQVADWHMARLAAGYFPLLLAGGLTPENVGQAVQVVQPWGVDVASGIERAPGKKDIHKMESFVTAVKAAGSERFSEDRAHTARHAMESGI